MLIFNDWKGASGSGKTTLLNVLNFRNRGKLITDGRIKINGHDIYSNAQLTETSAYIEQEDSFIGYLKVGEQLRFQAELKMNRDLFNSEDRGKKIEQVRHGKLFLLSNNFRAEIKIKNSVFKKMTTKKILKSILEI